MDRKVYIIVLLAALSGCQGGSGDDGSPADSFVSDPGGDDPTTDPTAPEPEPSGGVPLSMDLGAGAYWEFAWVSKETSTVQGEGTSVTTDAGNFRVVLGEPTVVGGVTAYPIRISGESSDGTVDFAPEWTHVAADNGSLYCSTDGDTLAACYDGTVASWSGAGFFVPFGDQLVSAVPTTFDGQWNTLSAVKVSREASGGGCTYYPSINQNICSDSSYEVREAEYYKDGIGPIGYIFHSSYSDSGGGFYTAFVDERSVELVDTSLAAADGSVFERPPWQPVADLNHARRNPSLVATNGRVYALCGYNGGAGITAVEAYDPEADAWTDVSDMPVAMSYCTAEAIGGRVYVQGSGTPLYEWDPVTDVWTTNTGAVFDDPSYDSVAIGDQYLMLFHSANDGIRVQFYDTVAEAWQYGYGYATTDHRWFCTAVDGTDVYLTGGYRQYVLGDTSDKLFGGMYAYDASTGDWSTAAGPGDLYDCASTNLAGNIIVLGGTDGNEPLSIVREYDPGSGLWRDLPSMLQPRQDFDAVVLDGRLYVAGGYAGDGAISSVHVFTQ